MMTAGHSTSDASPSAASQWLDEHGGILYRFALARVRDSNVAEDLVQETLLAALGAKERFSGKSTERTWLVGILKNKVADHLRKEFKRRPLTDAETSGPDEFFNARGAWKVAVPKWKGDPQALLERSEFREALDKCLSKLPWKTAALFWLRESAGTNTEQLCQEFQLSATNVWQMLHRARTHLRQCLTIHWFGGSDP
jgi:RNA polymerase sigma-70 factor (ECF subfamily)